MQINKLSLYTGFKNESLKNSLFVDSHTHISNSEEYDLYKRLIAGGRMAVAFNASKPHEMEKYYSLISSLEGSKEIANNIKISFGIHPWEAVDSTGEIDKLLPYYEKADAIGEIGMDRVWTKKDLKQQEACFLKQLCIAIELSKPIILHTKGCEEIILRHLRSLGRERKPILVHWYSGSPSYIEGYLEEGCYFSVGADWKTNSNVREIIEKVPISRLLTETDGYEAVLWANSMIDVGVEKNEEDHRNPTIENVIVSCLDKSLNEIARVKGMNIQNVGKYMYKNFNSFFNF